MKNLLFGKRLIILVGVLLTVAAAPVGILALNQYRDAEATWSDALDRDARSYAADYGVDVDEAVRRLQLQETIGDLDAKLESNEASTFGGLWIEHGPAKSDFKVMVRFTRNGEQTLQEYGKYVANGPLSGMVEVRGAEATLATLKSKRDQAVDDLARLGVSVDSGINIRENKAEIYVVERGRLDTAMSENHITLPSKTELITVGSLSRKAAEIYGGLEIYVNLDVACTTGFSVEDQDHNKGITTAGHCKDNLSHNGTALTYETGHYSGSLDVQWHTSSFDEKNKVKTGSASTREINDTQNSHSVGQYVCKYGIKTEYSCGRVIDVNFNPGIQDSECHPASSCDWNSTWIRVRSSNGDDMCTLGDSGGPFFLGNKAVGTMAFCQARSINDRPSGSNGDDDAIYMEIDYVGNIGLTVLTE